MHRGRTLLGAAAGVHFALLLGVCTGETVRLIRSGLTIAPLASKPEASQEGPPSTEDKSRRVLSRIPKTYLHLAGIESGYGFFAPNVPPAYRLTIELSDEQQVLQRGLLSPSGGETDLRLASFLDALGRRTPGDIRDVMFHVLAASLFSENLEATRISLLVDRIRAPSVQEFRRGTERSIERAYAYRFRRGEVSAAAE